MLSLRIHSAIALLPRPGALRIAGALAGILLLTTAIARATISFGQLDDFQAGTPAGWSEGFSSPNPPVTASGGPLGTSDLFLKNVSSGGFGAGSKLVMFNHDQWLGDYVGNNVTRLEMDLANFGTTEIDLHLAFAGGTLGTSFGTTDPVVLPANAGWRHVSIDLSPAALTLLGGSETAAQVFSSVTEIRMLSSAAGPAANGDGIAATLGVDNIRATRRPGDATFDDAVNFPDLLALAKNYGRTGDATWAQGDFNFDHNVDFTDLLTLAKNYGSGPSTAAAESAADYIALDDAGGPAFKQDWALGRSLVPEPTLALLSAGGPIVIARRRRLSTFRGR